MSVINQMLKDLEKRSRTNPVVFQGLPAALFLPDKNQAKKIGILLLTILTASLCLFFFYKSILIKKHSPAHLQSIFLTQSEIKPAVEITHRLMTPLHLTPAILTAITLQEEEKTTFLRLMLSQTALYEITKHNKDQLIIHIENARLTTSLPPFNTVHSAIKKMKLINQKNGDLKILITLKEGVELSHLELNETAKLPELQVDLVSPAMDNETQANTVQQHAFTDEKSDTIVKLRTDLSMSDRYQEALSLSTQGRRQEAAILLTELLNQDPEYAPARESLAELLIEKRKISQAQQVIRIGLQQRPFYPSYIQLKAKILVNSGKIKEALHLLQQMPPDLTVNPNYHAFIAALYQRQGQYESAEKLYEQLLAIQPNNATWWMGLGIALENMGKQSLAIEAYQKAKNSNALNPELKMYAETRMHNLQQG